MKELVKRAYEMGYEAFPSLPCNPRMNSKFMKIVPDCYCGDEKGCRLRSKMHKQYINGWASSFIDKILRSK